MEHIASVVTKTPSGGIIYKAARTLPLPQYDLLTLLFETKHSHSQENTKLHIDADNPSKSITKAELRPLVKRLAHTLRTTYGIGQHGPNRDTVLCIASGHFHLPTLFYGVVAAGGIYSASNPGSTPSELLSQLTQVSATLIFCTPDTLPTATAAAQLFNLPPSRVLTLSATSPTLTLTPLSTPDTPLPISDTELSWTRITSPSTLATSIICLLFSSGTTGPPKAVLLSHTNMTSQASLVIDASRAHHPTSTHTARTIAHLPAAHIAGVQGYFVNAFYSGGSVYWMPRFDFAKFLAYNKKYAITGFFSVPPVFLAIAKSPAVRDQFDSLEYAVSGAAPMGAELQREVRKKLGRGRTQVCQTWGLSETTGSMTVMPRGGPEDETGSVSMLVSNGEARIVDEGGKDVQPGEEGEIWVRGPQVTRGYWENERANKEAFVDGWFCTGDVGVFRDGLFYIVDRKKELIKYKGSQVAPAELEALLVSHPQIFDAAVIGVPGEATEVPRAYIVADPKAITAEQVATWVAGRVANHKKLRGGVFFLQAIPKSPSGKILRKDLRELAKKQEKGSRL
ncbi:hypothetical protein B0T16DRAFT_331838 [Cercophora newfieldiana]|uniref:Uncharacterized protein n=1 Tax=Cercophora newfieldiana TaxID=92897 RepID=A0AA40CMG4_9PEZI|nr:hypothetical protein B0T16DRAFT_331838 [Cercophora newfieldiana]